MPTKMPVETIPKDAHSHLRVCLLWAVPLILAVMAGTFTVDGGFVQDDKSAVVQNPLVVKEGIPLSDFFRRDSWGFSDDGTIFVWRPLLPMIWRLVWAIHPGSPLLFRLLTVLLHLMATGTVLLLARKLFQDGRVAWTAGLLFAVHPIHAEALGEIVGQADILAAFLGMLAVYAALERRRAITPFLVTALLAAACLAKESAVVFAAVIAVVALMPAGDRQRGRLSISLCAALIAVATILVQLSFKRAGEGPLGNLAFAAHGEPRVLHALYVIGRAVGMCFIPVGMSPFHDYAAVDLSPGTLLPYAIPGILFLCIGAGAVWVSFKKRSIAGMIGVGLFLGPIVINSSLIVPVGTELAERLLYPASAVASVIAAHFLRPVAGSRPGRILVVALVLLFSVQSWSAQRPWRNQLDLYAQGVEAEPLSARVHWYYGMNVLSSGDVMTAAWHFMASTYILKHFPNRVDPAPIFQLGQLPVDRRLAEGPAIFDPEDPCRFLSNYLQVLEKKTPNLARYMRVMLSNRYPGCGGGPSGQGPPAKPAS